MSNELLLAAEVLEKAAAYIEAVEAEKVAASTAALTKQAADLKARFSSLTGDEISDETAAKLASAEPDVVALIEKMAGSLRAPDSLGGPGDMTDGSPSEPRTAKEAAAVAEDRFASWLSNKE